MGIKCVTGMSCLMRKDILDQAGGLIAFAQYIAEDYFMAKAIADRFARLLNTRTVKMAFDITLYIHFTCYSFSLSLK